ncbi:MAG: hypothetical protein ABWY58_07455 [Aeromicrobium sp.]
MSAVPRWIGLPVAAVAMVAGTLTVQVTHGGGSYEPLRPAAACAERPATSRASGIEGLTERLVLIGLADAACTLGVGREELTLQLARSGDPTDAQVDALRRGLRSAVRQMKADGTLPRASELVDEVIDEADLNGLVKRLIRALPASLVDKALKTDDVLYRTIDDLDLREVLENLDDSSSLDAQVEPVVTQAVKDSLKARLRDLV